MNQPSHPDSALPPEGDSFVLRHRKAILFLTAALCIAGGYAAYTMPAAVFPQTNFPRVVILIDNGVMPADEMMATITRPVEEAMKNIPGTVNIRSTTGRGSAAVDVFFDWSTDMVQAELYVLGRLAQIRSTLPASATPGSRSSISGHPRSTIPAGGSWCGSPRRGRFGSTTSRSRE